MGRDGRRFGRRHQPVESCHSLSAWGYFQWAQMWEDDDTFKIKWEFDDESCQIKFTRDGRKWTQSIDLTWQACGYGGKRAWFRCPRCRRRVGKIYLPTRMYSGGERVHEFLCNNCYDLTYLQHQRRDQYEPLLYRAYRVADRWLGKISKGWIGRKKGQHWKTFEKRADQYEELVRRSNAHAFARFSVAYERIFKGSKKRKARRSQR